MHCCRLFERQDKFSQTVGTAYPQACKAFYSAVSAHARTVYSECAVSARQITSITTAGHHQGMASTSPEPVSNEVSMDGIEPEDITMAEMPVVNNTDNKDQTVFIRSLYTVTVGQLRVTDIIEPSYNNKVQSAGKDLEVVMETDLAGNGQLDLIVQALQLQAAGMDHMDGGFAASWNSTWDSTPLFAAFNNQSWSVASSKSSSLANALGTLEIGSVPWPVPVRADAADAAPSIVNGQGCQFGGYMFPGPVANEMVTSPGVKTESSPTEWYPLAETSSNTTSAR